MPIPHVLNTAVVTTNGEATPEEGYKNAQCPGIALKRAIKATVKPPSRTTLARQPYVMFDLSSFSPRERQQYLKALTKQVNRWKSQRRQHKLEVSNFSNERPCADDTET